MKEKFCYFVLDPREYSSLIAPLAFLKKCCKGCINEYHNGDIGELERASKCHYCIEEVIGPAYRRREPFIFNRITGEITLVK